jgi:hypothetical protein
MNTGSIGTHAAIKKQAAPTADKRPAAFEELQRETSTWETTHGVSRRPKLPPPAIRAFSVGLALK